MCFARPRGERKGWHHSFQRRADKRLKSGEPAIRYQHRILEALEHFFVCPYCGERISMVLDTSVDGQTYVEDCEVCCQPLEVHYTVKEGEVRDFEPDQCEFRPL